MATALRRNIILIHLESVSATTLWQYRACMGTVWNMMENSLAFTRFQSTATSTAMTMNSIFSGDSSRLDYASDYRQRKLVPKTWPKAYQLSSVLFKIGYCSINLTSNPMNPPFERMRDDGSINVGNSNIGYLLSKAEEAMTRCAREKRPFYLFFWDARSHAAFTNSGKDAAQSVDQRFAAGYRQIDQSFHQLMAIAARLNLLDETIVLAYGDHGDELWTHGFHTGYCHATAPYASLCHTPFFIRAPNRAPEKRDDLACTDDIYHTICAFARSGCEPLKSLKTSPFAGIDLFSESRKHVFSSNLLPLQLEYSDFERGLGKAYAVTNGVYRLVVSTGDGVNGNAGMELFCDSLDPLNSCNLLHFFTMSDDGELGEFFIPENARAKHLAAAFADDAAQEVRNAFAELKPTLHQYIKKREENGLRHYAGTEEKRHLFPDDAFDKVKPYMTGLFE